MQALKNCTLKIKITFHGDESFFGPGIAELLALVGETGSVKDACKKMDLSYTKGWFILNRAEDQLGEILVERNHGGKEGGGASLTEFGKELLKEYDKLTADVEAYATREFRKRFQ